MNQSRRKEGDQSAYLIEKYGLESVETLIDYLEDQFGNMEDIDLKKAHKLQDQIKYLKEERMRHFNNQKRTIIDHIMNCLEEEKVDILREFDEERLQGMKDFIEEARSIEQQLLDAHEIQKKQLEEELQKNYSNFISKKSQLMIQLRHQLDELCQREEYQEAELVRQMLQKETIKHRNRKNQEWKNHKEKQLRNLQLRQEKELNSLMSRLKAMADQEIQAKDAEFDKLVKKMEMHASKIYRSLVKESKYKTELNSLASSRHLLRQSRNMGTSRLNISKQFWKLEPETGPSSQAQTDRLSPDGNPSQPE